MNRKTVPDKRSCDAEAIRPLMLSPHGLQVATFRRTETGTARTKKTATNLAMETLRSGTKQRCRSSPFHIWTPMMPKMEKTKKQSMRMLPSIGSVSSSSVTRMRMSASATSIITPSQSSNAPRLNMEQSHVRLSTKEELL